MTRDVVSVRAKRRPWGLDRSRCHFGWAALLTLLIVVPKSESIAGGPVPQVRGGSGADPDWRIERSSQLHEVPTETSIRIENLRGDIRTRPSTGTLLEVSAVLQHDRRDPQPPELSLEEKDGHVEVSVRYPGVDPTVPRRELQRADLTLYVPASSSLELRSETGDIEVRGHHGRLLATSQVGDLSLDASGSVRGHTERGAIDGILRPGGPDGTWRLQTETGAIRMRLGREATAVIQGTTRGLLTTDFSIEIERDLANGEKHFTAVVGTGGREMTLISLRGDIQLIAR